MTDDNKIEVLATPVFGGEPENTFEPHNPLHRPQMHYKKMIFALLGLVILITALLLIPSAWYPIGKIWVCIGASFIYIAIFAKKGTIWLVHLYQSKAPDHVRLRCVFEPSCSEYMILAIEKYGLVRGVFKGVRRLLRCRPCNAGVDYP